MTDQPISTAATMYWLARLSPASNGGRLPPSSTPQRAHATISLEIPPLVRDAVHSRARGSARASFALVAAAFAAALERRSLASDVLFAARAPGTDADELALPIRVGIDAAVSFKQHAVRIHAALDEAGRQREGLRDACDLLGITVDGGVPDRCEFLLHAVHWPDGACPSITISARVDGMNGVALARLRDHVLAVLAAALERPDIRLDELPPMSPTDAEQLRSLNGTNMPWADPDDPAHACIARQARRTPDATAVKDDVRSLTYAELDAAANTVRRMLQRHHVGTETVVAMLPPRDIRWVAALLGIWKAGGVYLPLDLVQAPPRLAAMLRTSRCTVVLAAGEDLATVGSILDNMRSDERPPVVTLPMAADDQPDTAPPDVQPNQLAYVIFTSGSTGLPKGAMVEHAGMRNHLEAKVRALALGPRDVVAVTASASFDVSIWQLMAALLAGGTVYVGNTTVVRDPVAQLRAVNGAGVTILEVVPSQLRAMLELTRGAMAPPLRTLRRLVVNGEPLGYDLCDAWRLAYPDIPLMNAYGPTECSDDVTHLMLDAWNGEGPVPIGRPLPNTRIHVMDSQLRPLPFGVCGEICVSGDGVGRGYVADPERTAITFVPDPMSPMPGARLYRTGDRGRWTHDGDLYCLGRLDHQVKLRGFRIELGEIETALRRHPDIGDAAVTVREDVPGGPALVAYVVSRDGRHIQRDEVRAFLRAQVPDYMIPSAFSTLPSLPLMPSGKVDRRALPPPTVPRGSNEAPVVPPRTPIEHALSDIWAELLERSDFGIHDNFFDLGGHSLLATRVVARVRDRIGIELPLEQIFSAPTVASLSLAVGERLVARAVANGETSAALEVLHAGRAEGV